MVRTSYYAHSWPRQQFIIISELHPFAGYFHIPMFCQKIIYLFIYESFIIKTNTDDCLRVNSLSPTFYVRGRVQMYGYAPHEY